ncbi:MAG: hypothetical protein SFU98_05370 [Leptospiraceae bacterium]|nr:hypothetical protein [Leptospiraceae bacterium]
MIYLAALMIVLGFALVLLGSRKNPPKQTIKQPHTNNPQSSERIIQNLSPKLRSNLFNLKYPDIKNTVEIDQKILMDRAMKNLRHNFPKTPEKREEVIEIPLIQDETQVLERREDIFQLKGVLFLDYSHKIPFEKKQLTEEEWEEAHFQHLHRVGKAKMLELDGEIQFQTGKETHDIKLDEIDQIIFYDKAFTLIPNNPSKPSSLVFSEESNSFKRVLTEKFK